MDVLLTHAMQQHTTRHTGGGERLMMMKIT